MKPISIFLVVCVLAVSVAISGCAGQSPSGAENTSAQGVQSPGASADWCPAGQTSNIYNAMGSGATIVWTFRGLSSYTFPDATIQVCCMDGQVTEQNGVTQVKLCVDHESKHMVELKALTGQTLVKFMEMYPKGTQTCIRMFGPATGELLSETCS